MSQRPSGGDSVYWIRGMNNGEGRGEASESSRIFENVSL